ncbi:hypothetical protein D8S78_05255 [Natrialba swarupiae]|nr:hypothetical protein [Natrialba swarupiae]
MLRAKIRRSSVILSDKASYRFRLNRVRKYSERGSRPLTTFPECILSVFFSNVGIPRSFVVLNFVSDPCYRSGTLSSVNLPSVYSPSPVVSRKAVANEAVPFTQI